MHSFSLVKYLQADQYNNCVNSSLSVARQNKFSMFEVGLKVVWYAANCQRLWITYVKAQGPTTVVNFGDHGWGVGVVSALTGGRVWKFFF